MNPTFAESLHARGDPHSDQGLRSAALLLHAMSEKDRHWVLSQVSSDRLEALKILLTELDALGMPVNSQHTRDLLDARKAVVVKEPTLSPEEQVTASIAGANADAMFHLLDSEPHGLIDRVMALDDWPWRTEVLARLRGVRPSEFAAVETGARVDPRVVDRDRSELDRATLRRLATQLARANPRAESTQLRGASQLLSSWWHKTVQQVQRVIRHA